MDGEHQVANHDLLCLHPDLRFRKENAGCLVLLNGRWHEGNRALFDLLRRIDRAFSFTAASMPAEALDALWTRGFLVHSVESATCGFSRELGAESPASMSAPIKLGIEITGLCNLECSFCSAADYPARHMPDWMIRQALSWCASRGVFEVTLSGGEPFLHPKIETILEYFATSRGVGLLPLTTNGTAPFMERLPYLTELGMKTIQISVPALPLALYPQATCRTIHESKRAIESATRGGIEVVVSTVVFPQWASELEWVVDLAEQTGAIGVHFMGLLPNGRGAGHPTWCAASTVDYYKSILRAYRRHQKMRLDFNRNMLVHIARDRPGAAATCPAGTDQIYIMPSGDVFPCNVLAGSSNYKCGNMNRSSLDEIWERSNSLASMRETPSALLKVSTQCRECPQSAVCPGGCWADRTGGLGTQPRMCVGAIPGAWDELRVIAAELAESGIMRGWL